MKTLAYKLLMMLISYLTSKDFISMVEQRVREYLNIGEQNPEAIRVAIKNDEEVNNKKSGLNDMLMDAVIGLVTHEEMEKRKVEPSDEPTTKAGVDALSQYKVKVTV